MKIGARIIKTGITLVIAIYLSKLLHLEPVIFTSIAATLAIQRSIYRSWQYGIEQIQSNIVGATIAMIFVYYIGTHPIAIAVAIMLVIGINLELGFEKSIALSIVTVLSIMEGGGQEANFFLFALDRFLLILIGLLSALVVNALLFPPRYDKRLITKLKNMEEQTSSIFRFILDREKNQRTIHSTLDELQKEVETLWDLFELEEEQKSYFRKKLPYTASRKLVVLKAMIDTSEFSIQLFRMVEKYHNTIQRLPENFYHLLFQQFQNLANYQDKIYSKFDGKILSSSHHSQNEMLFVSHWEFFEKMTASNLDSQTILDVSTISSMLREFNLKLDHLDKLVDSFHTYHRSNSNK